jgi:hypothetical protein
MLETHYTNPSLHTGVRDSSGLRVWHTPKRRPHDAGVLSVRIFNLLQNVLLKPNKKGEKLSFYLIVNL